MDIFSIPINEPFKLYISTKPSGGEALNDEIRNLTTLGSRVVLCSLLTANEIIKYRLDNESQICEFEKIDFMHLAVMDESIPAYKYFLEFMEKLINKTKSADAIVIHCKHGIGRSGMIAVALLLNFGHNLDKAFNLVSKVRGYTVPQSKSQFKLLVYYYNNEILKSI